MQYSQYTKRGFIPALALCLARLDSSTHPSSLPKSQKQGERDEERDTVEPRLSGLLHGFLRGVGTEDIAVQIEKRSREEVLWNNARLPWHRSATWLSVRVALQLIWSRKHKTPNSNLLFKGFMAFFISSCIVQAQKLNIPDDLLYCMLAKLNRRCLKLSQLPYFQNDKPAWLNYCSRAHTEAVQYLENRWSDIQHFDEDHLPLKELKALSFSTDSSISIPGLESYLSKTKITGVAASKTHVPHADYIFSRTEGLEPPSIHNPKNQKLLALANLESWIATTLRRWLQANVNNEKTCGRLADVMKDYYSVASSAYGRNPFNLSIMWLSILELWVACDKAATQQVPLLRNYSPEVPVNLLEPLLLPSLPLMTRLHDAESYIRHREQRAKPGYPSVFAGFGHPESFAVQFYSTSANHQSIHKKISASAEQVRTAKIEELGRLDTKYDDLKHQSECTSHEQTTLEESGSVFYICEPGCPKCKLEREINNMRISVHEWPLPSNNNEAIAVVFELQVPTCITQWRCVTLRLTDLLTQGVSGHQETSQGAYSPSYYSELRKYVTGTDGSRLRLVSEKKPFIAAHYKYTKVSMATRDNVCVPHGCEYHYYDSLHKRKSLSMVSKMAVAQNCSFAALTQPPMTHLIRGYRHSSNRVIARQSYCPADMTLDGFKAFGHIRSGHRIQWMNILAQLAMPSVDFNQVETALVVLQAISEAGPCGDDPSRLLRNAHKILHDGSFASSLLNALQTAFRRIEENWECDVALLIFSSICTRLLCTSCDQGIRKLCGNLLSEMRAASRQWALLLAEKKAESESMTEQEDFNRRVLGMSYACSSTFAAGPDELDIVFGDEESVKTLLEISILIHDHRQVEGQNIQGNREQSRSKDTVLRSSLMAVCSQSWYRSCYLSQTFLLARLPQYYSCIDNAIRTFWAAYTTGTDWSQGDDGQQHLITSNYSSPDGQRLVISLDSLEGRLLVNGLPISQLPPQYYQDPTYQAVFGNKTFKIGPSTRRSMEFTAAREQEGWIIHFAMKNGALVIQACKDGSTWEFIPPKVLTGAFPEPLIKPYRHWMNIKTGVIEFRHYKHPWCSGGNIWRANTTSSQIVLEKDDKVLISPTSQTARCISGILEALESPDYITMIFDKAKSELEIDLPRYDLAFTLQRGTSILGCKKYPGMCIDGVQSVRTLVGLKSKLVLQPQAPGSSRRKAIIIPYGTPQIQRDRSSHPVTRITPTDFHGLDGPGAGIERRRHIHFEIDSILGRLVDSGSLQSKLLLCHLHATTSYCLADPLTGRTGTEEALRILKSAAVVSFSRLQYSEAQQLRGIAQLSPLRSFYPKHLMEMQQIEWNDHLCPLAQNDEFHQVVQSILGHANACEIYFNPGQSFQMSQESNVHLRDRALIRCSAFRVDGFGAEFFTSSQDRAYRNRDIVKGSPIEKHETRACHITKLLLSKDMWLIEPLGNADSLVARIYSILGSQVSGSSEALGSLYGMFNIHQRSSSSRTVGEFDIQWLDSPSKTIGKN